MKALRAQSALPLEFEEWRPVVGWEGWYEVSDLGRVRRVKPGPRTRPGRLLKPRPDGAGYPCVALCRDGQPRQRHVHRLVALAFLGPCPPGHETNHINGIKGDAKLVNLEWATHSENTLHAYSTGLAPRGERHWKAKLRGAAVLQIRRARGRRTGAALARQYGVSEATISDIQVGRRWAHLAAGAGPGEA